MGNASANSTLGANQRTLDWTQGKTMRGLLTLLAVAGLASLAAAGPQAKGNAAVVPIDDKTAENFLRTARVGDWVSYKSIGSTPSTFKQTVIAKTADEIT